MRQVLDMIFESIKKFILTAGLCIIFLVVGGCDQFGKIPHGAHLTKIKDSSNYDPVREEFLNLNRDVLNEMGKGHSFWDDPLKRLKHNYFFNKNETVPKVKLPEYTLGIPKDFGNSRDTIKFIWLGHSSLLVSIDDKILLIDPIFSRYAAPVPFLIKRFQMPVIPIEDLPDIDHILISHDHYDHLDMETIAYFRNKNISFITPLGVGSHLRRWGIDEKKIFELDWGESIELKGLKFNCTPAQHFSGRMASIRALKTLWASWVVKSETKSFYFSGDSGYGQHYKNIGRTHGPFNLVFMDSGQYNERWRAVHNMPEEVIQGFSDLQGEHLIPVHWAMFSLSLHNWYDPGLEISKRAEIQNISVLTPKIGEPVDLNRIISFEKWWENIK